VHSSYGVNKNTKPKYFIGRNILTSVGSYFPTKAKGENSLLKDIVRPPLGLPQGQRKNNRNILSSFRSKTPRSEKPGKNGQRARL
jgi:hypothetical protein